MDDRQSLSALPSQSEYKLIIDGQEAVIISVFHFVITWGAWKTDFKISN